ncbi:MAG: hypothetical protein RIC85_03915 [Gammaproteobacteria bacterium]
MKLIIERGQRTGGLMTKKAVFFITVRADISQVERERINQYKLADIELYASGEIVDRGSGLLGLASRMVMKAQIKTMLVRDLVEGKSFESDNIIEIISIEDTIMAAAKNFKEILDVSATFGGRVVIDLDKPNEQ